MAARGVRSEAAVSPTPASAAAFRRSQAPRATPLRLRIMDKAPSNVTPPPPDHAAEGGDLRVTGMRERVVEANRRFYESRASDYGEYPEQHYVIYRDTDHGGQMCPVLLKRRSQDSDAEIMDTVRDHYGEHGRSYTKHSFFKARLAGKNIGRPAHETIFDRLREAGQLVSDGESDGAFSRYVPLSVPDANEENPKQKKRKKHGK